MTQPLRKFLAGLCEEAGEFATLCQFDDSALYAERLFGMDEPQVVAGFDRFGVAALVFEFIKNIRSIRFAGINV